MIMLGRTTVPAVPHVAMSRLIYRAVTDYLLGQEEPVTPGSADERWASAIDLACQLAATHS